VTTEPALAPVAFEVAGLVCRLESTYPKPLLWLSELHPAFASPRRPDVVVTVEREDSYWTAGLPWIGPDRVLDAPLHAVSGGGAVIRTAYYEAELDAERRRVRIRLAAGFGVGGAVRAVYAALLPARGACLVRGSIRALGDGAVLVCGDAADGVVALVASGESIEAEPTPFHAGASPTRGRRRRIRAIECGATDGARRIDVAARVLEQIVVVDHSPATLERVLDIVTRLATTVPSITAASAMADAVR
jgi:hypothetical protein